MIAYNPKDWLIFIFKVHRADTIRQLFPLLLMVAIYSAGIAWWELTYFGPGHSWLKNLPVLHSLLGFVISLLLVFRTNTAYDRWWEGRKLWGALVNNSRNLAIKLNALLDGQDTDTRSFYRRMIPLYAKVLMAHLQAEQTRWSLDEKEHPEFATIDMSKHVPNQVARLMISKAVLLHRSGKISGDELIVINGELLSFTDICGACERIKNTPIPYSYSAFIKKFIFFYIMTLPLGLVFQLGYLVVPVVTLVLYVLASLEIVAEEIEDPFGTDTNDLPMDKISDNIQRHIAELI